jgi:potassium-transporting ATPase KdpC subunit
MKSLIIALRIFLFFTVLTGIAYPLLVTGIAGLVFPSKANGSMIFKNGQPIGSLLIGQSFDSADIYFTSRPSANAYNPLPSGGSNLGLTNKKLKDQFDNRKEQFLRVNRLDAHTEIPSEMLFASASGLDPHISPEAALLQAGRICRARNFSLLQEIRLKKMISQLAEPSQFLCLGQKRINVLLLNLETDKIK